MWLLISALGCSLSTGTASANFGMVSLCAKVDLRTRAGPVGVSRPPLQSTSMDVLLKLIMTIYSVAIS